MIPGSDPGDEDTPVDRDQAGAAAAEREVNAAVNARKDHLYDLAERCDHDSMREEAIDALEGVVKSHEPPPPPRFRW